MTTPPAVPHVPTSASTGTWAVWLSQIARTLNLVLRGKLNCTATVTLTPGATSTTLIDERVGTFSTVVLEAQTASAAAARMGLDTGIHVVCSSGEAIIYHPPGDADDQVFSVIIIG